MPRTQRTAQYLQRRRWSITEARDAIAALESSGLSTAEFARREGLEVNRLYRWQRQLTEELGGATALPAPAVVEIRPRRAEPVEIVFGSGRILRVAETIDASALARFIEVLERTEEC